MCHVPLHIQQLMSNTTKQILYRDVNTFCYLEYFLKRNFFPLLIPVLCHHEHVYRVYFLQSMYLALAAFPADKTANLTATEPD